MIRLHWLRILPHSCASRFVSIDQHAAIRRSSRRRTARHHPLAARSADTQCIRWLSCLAAVGASAADDPLIIALGARRNTIRRAGAGRRAARLARHHLPTERSARSRYAATIQRACYGARRVTIRRPSALHADEFLLSKGWTARFDSLLNAAWKLRLNCRMF